MILYYIIYIYIYIPNISQSKDDNGLNRNGIYHYDLGRKSYYEKTESGIIMGSSWDKSSPHVFSRFSGA